MSARARASVQVVFSLRSVSVVQFVLSAMLRAPADTRTHTHTHSDQSTRRGSAALHAGGGAALPAGARMALEGSVRSSSTGLRESHRLTRTARETQN